MRFREAKTDEEKAAREKQDAEQAELPYTWKQNDIKWVTVEFTVPGNYKSRDLVIDFGRSKLKAGVKGQAPVIEGEFPHPIRVDDSTWTMVTAADGATKTVDIQLKKASDMEWWPHVVTSAPKIDVSMIEPEETSLKDIDDAETRKMVEKMMHENMQNPEQKQASKEAENMQRLKQLQEQTGMDFSQAQIHHG